MTAAVLVILDGMRRDLISENYMPQLCEFTKRGTSFQNHLSIFPSVTRACAASIATGCSPSRHELTGNRLVIADDWRLPVYDSGHPEFLRQKREMTGRSLGVPTMAEMLAPHGGAIVFSNVSPGAAYAHDPDGHGYVYHRDGSFGPGRKPLPSDEGLSVTADMDGDRQMTERFVHEVLGKRKPALSVLWFGHPDTTQHDWALGSAEHIQALRQVDSHVGTVIKEVTQLRHQGEEILFLIGSDHGHQTVIGTIDIRSELLEAGIISEKNCDSLAIAANGTAALIYLNEQDTDLSDTVSGFLQKQSWVGSVHTSAELMNLGLSQRDGLVLAVSMRCEESTNEYQIPGTAFAVGGRNSGTNIGAGQHGGLGKYEQAPFLVAQGPGFEPGIVCRSKTSILDIAPTIVSHFDLPVESMDGRCLQNRNPNSPLNAKRIG